MGDEVHFLDPGDAAAGAEDVLDAGPRRRPPRRLFGLAGVVGAALVVGLVVAHRGGENAPGTTPSSTPTSSPSTVTEPVDVPAVRAEPFGPANVSLLYRDGRLWGLSDTQLAVLGSGGHPRVRGVPPSSGGGQLVYDDRARAVWVVPLFGEGPGRVREYDPRLRLIRSARLPMRPHSATELDGTLYLSIGAGLLSVGPHASSARLVSWPDRLWRREAALVSVDADPTRHRLLLLGYPEPSLAGVLSWSPVSGAGRWVPIDGVNPSLAIVGGRIWVAGFRTRSAVLERLDPGTLRPVAASPLVARIGTGVLVVGSGARSFLARRGTDPSLWCLDGDHARVLQQWYSPAGNLTGGGRRVWVATSVGLMVLRMHGCPG